MGGLGRDATSGLGWEGARVLLVRLGHEEGGGPRLFIRSSPRDDERDLKLLRGQALGGEGVAAARRLSARGELRPRALPPGSCAQTLEGLYRFAKRHSRVGAAPGAPKAFAIAQFRARPFERSRRSAMELERTLELALEILLRCQQPAAPCGRGQRPAAA